MSGVSVDIIATMRDYLEGLVPDGWQVWATMPGARPDRFVYLERDGGTVSLSHDAPILRVDVWSQSKSEGYEVAAMLRDHIVRHLPPVVGGVRVTSRREYTGVVYEPPTVTGASRWRFTIQITHQHIREET